MSMGGPFIKYRPVVLDYPRCREITRVKASGQHVLNIKQVWVNYIYSRNFLQATIVLKIFLAFRKSHDLGWGMAG